MFFLSFLCLIEVKDVNHIATINGTGEITIECFSKVAVSEIIQIIIKHGPTKISGNAFTTCTSLQILNVSLSIADIPSTAFNGLQNTVFICVAKEHLSLSNDKQGALYNANKTILLHVPRKLKTFQIPESVEIIKSVSVQRCSFSSLNIPSRITLLENHAFHISTISEITFSPGINSLIIDGAFQWGNFPTVHIPSSCVKISSISFLNAKVQRFIFDDYENSNLTTLEYNCFGGFLGTSIILPQKVTGIPPKCFENSPNLEEVFIPRDCKVIEMTAFSGCTKLSTISVDPNNTYFTYVNGSIFNKARTEIYFIPPTTSLFELPAELEKIGTSILQSCPNLKEINTSNNKHFYFEEGVLYDYGKATVIGSCGGVDQIALLDSATRIRGSAFSSSKVRVVEIGQNSKLETVESSAFNGCSDLESLRLPKALRSLGSSAFEGCLKLAEVLFEPDCNLTAIPYKCFYSSSIVRITIPRNVVAVNQYSFCGQKIVNVTLLDNNSLRRIESNAFSSCTNLKRFTNPCSLVTVEGYAFNGCSKLEFPFGEAQKLREIGKYGFSKNGMKTINLCSSLEILGDMVFSNCKSLIRVKFEENVSLSLLPSSIFVQCSKLETIILSKHIQDLEYSAFSGCTKLINIDCSKSIYLKNINGLVYKDSEENLKQNSDTIEEEKTLLLVLCPPGKIEAEVDKYTIDMKSNCFRGCSLLTKVIFNEKSILERVKEYTFSGCSKLSKITLPKSVLAIEANSFSDCISLKNLPLLANCSINAISTSCFKNSGIEILKIPDNIEIIESNCFADCKDLKEVTIGSEIKSIGPEVFFNCPTLKSIRYCGKKDASKGADFIGNSNFIIDVSIFYETTKFGTNLVRKSLDPECSLITEWRLKEESNSLILIMSLISEEDNNEVAKDY